MRRKAIFGLAALAIAGVALVAYLLVDRYYPWLFTSDPYPPVLVAPADGAVLPNGHGTPAMPFAWEFTWSGVPRCERYEVVVDNAAKPELGKKVEVSEPRFSATFSAISFDKLDGWSWKVRVQVRGRWSQWSESRAFRLEPAQKDKRPPWQVVLELPRFDGKMIDGKWSPTHEEVLEAVKDLPCLPVKWTFYGDNNGRRRFQFPLVPTAESDLGDVAKALSKLGGDKKKPVAVVSLAKQLPITEEQFATLKKELATAKGIDWNNSGRWNGKGAPEPSGFLGQLALDEAGGAKFVEIRAAYKKAGITLGDGLIDK
jgi:hypothetical protein